ncbi:hypothetical protein H310_03559 [Aphanomyces invadans]|uniref:Expansin-like EG45 domain-containing protein n=1 Tax=Aphanomyces invadans TaxID=157072 RepID=A0A024UJB4_9STRA|nr:hypothetical protein H310_03559 [Aphanomyces invadans]ETW05917.1 hypothetical protein H310_03559 [Aphanomyces invadans]|eukprot:XP_008865694.1 hypothetical protein H310_03559 [Aphanomyces invadans]
MLYWRFILATAVSLATAAAQEFTGDGTGYVLGTPSSGNCNFMNVPKAVSTNYVALATERFAQTAACGKCVQVRCTNDRCKGATATEVLYVVDQCPGCAKDDLDFSREVFMKLTNGIEPGRLKMTWSFVTCPHTSDIVMCKKPGSNAFWFAVQPAGAVSGIGSVKINGKATSLIDSAFYFKLESSPGLDLSRVQFEVTPDSGGDAITATLDMSKDGCVSTGKQFGRSDGSPTAPPSSAAPPVSSKAPSTPVASTLEPTTTGSVVTTLSPSPDVSTSKATAVPLPVADSTTHPIDANDLHNETTTSPPVAFSIAQSTSSPNGVEISVQAQAEDQGLDLGYYLILAGGCVMAGVALAAIVHIRRKKWEDKDSDLDFNDAQTAIAAHRSDNNIAILYVKACISRHDQGQLCAFRVVAPPECSNHGLSCRASI